MRKHYSHTLLYLHETIALGARAAIGSPKSPPPEIVTWVSVAPALRDGWADSILQALKPSPLQ